MVIRGTADQLGLAEKVINDVDKSRAEVIIDVLVLEACRSKTRELGITPIMGGQPGFHTQIGLTSGGTPVPTGGTDPHPQAALHPANQFQGQQQQQGYLRNDWEAGRHQRAV